MGNSLGAKMIYYWIFILGGLTIAWLLNLLQTGMDFIILMAALTLVYWGMEFWRYHNRQKRGVASAKPAKKGGRK